MTQDEIVERIARELWNGALIVDGRRMRGVADWDDLGETVRDEVLAEVDAVLAAVAAAGLTIVEAEDGR